MNRTYVRVLGVVLILGHFSHSVVRAAEQSDHTPQTSAESSIRTEAKVEIFPAKYDQVISILEKEIEVKAIASDKLEQNKTFKVGGNNFLAEQLQILKSYREKLKDCSNESDKKLAEVLDSYIDSIHKSFTTDLGQGSRISQALEGIGNLLRSWTFVPSAPSRKPIFEVSEKVVNTFTIQIHEFLKAKANKHTDTKATFEAEDTKLTEALNKIAGALWNGKAEGKFRYDIFKEDLAKNDPITKSIVEKADEAELSLTKDTAVCKLVQSTSVVEQKPSGSKNDKGGPEKGTQSPVVPEKKPEGKNEEQLAEQQEEQSQGNGGGSSSANVNTGIEDLQNGLRAFQEALLQQQLLNQKLNDDFARAALEQNNDTLGRALQALGQQQPPDGARSANRENSDSRSPQISPSLDLGGKGAGQPNIPIPPASPIVAPNPLPLAAFQPPSAPIINFPGVGESKKWNDEPIRTPSVVTQDPRTTGLLELLKLQQGMLAQAQQPGGFRPGVPNVNNFGQQLSAFAPRRAASRGRVMTTRGRTGARMNGTASSGLQARIGVNSRARTQAPK